MRIKRRRVNKLKTKAFKASIKNEKTKKYRVHSDFISSVINEEIKPYEDDLKSYEKYRAALNEKTVENYFQNSKHDETTENIDSDSEIKNIINKAFNKPKELIRGPIKKLIEKNRINR